ncbi:MAG TPA: CopD family protein [Rhizomicrobium sp.]|nr:CopD family protein [Rhizomicrobium sp.]
MLAAARGLYFAAAMLLFGSTAFCAVLRRHLPIILPPPLAALRWSALAVAALAGCLWLAAAAAQMADALNAAVLMQTVTGTLFGQLFLVRMIALAALAGLFATERGGHVTSLPAARLLAAALMAGLALALPAATGHAANSGPPGFLAIGAAVDGAHLLTAGFWIGGLAVLAALFARREPNMLLALSLFSDWAMMAVLLLVMTGAINAASIVLGGRGRISPLYMGALGLKLALVLAMLTLAAVNRFRLLPRLDTGAIARNARLELGLGIIVVLLAGALGQLQPTL